MPTRFTRRLLPLPMLLLAATLLSRQAAAEATLLQTLMARLAQVPSRRATFREVRHFAALEGTLESTGHLVYSSGHLEKVTDWPQPERLEVDGDRLVLTSGNDAPRVIDMARAPELRVLIDAIRGPLLGDQAALDRAFTATTTGSMAAWTLTLTPRDPAAQKFLRTVQLAGSEGQPGTLTVTQANGDDQVMTITPQ